MKTFAKECTTWADVQADGLAGGRLTCDQAGRQNGTHHRETQSALQTLVMEDDHQIAFNSQAIRVLLQHKDYDFHKTRWPVYVKEKIKSHEPFQSYLLTGLA